MKTITLALLLLIQCSFASNYLKEANELYSVEEYSEAIKFYQKAALEEEPEAFYQLGRIYYEGKVVPKDYNKAHKYLIASHLLDYQKATYNLGIFYGNKKTPFYDAKKSYKTFLFLAQRGHAKAQNRLGMYYTVGIGIEKDYKLAVQWFEKSAKQNFIEAQCNLAFMYASGKGVWQNMGRAHAFAKPGFQNGHPQCKKVWIDFNLAKYPEDKGFKFKFYNKPE